MTVITEELDEMTIEGALYERLPENALRCYACAHRCLIKENRRGICKVRFNREGTLRVPWGYVAGLQSDPVEKKPFYHLLPGSDALTFGMLGCDFHCDYCQNWQTSQVSRDPAADRSVGYVQKVLPEQMVDIAQKAGARVVASSYNEPLITSEWSVAIFKKAREAGLDCVYVSNGNATPEVLNYLRPYLTGYKIDLKTMQDRHYRKLGGVLKHVLDSIKLAHQLGLWVEIVTLVVPGFNDSTDELMEAGRFIASVSKEIPWHVTAFHPDYKMTGPSPTSTSTIIRAAEIGREAGLNYTYAGNIPGRVEAYENTHCPNCQARLIRRQGFTLLEYKINSAGACPECGEKIPGVWHENPEDARTGGFGFPKMIIRR